MPVSNQTALVAAVKDDCITRDIIPVPQQDNGDSAQITWRVAWELKDQGALLIKKSPSQNGWIAEDGPYIGQKFSHDAIAFADGWADCLISAGPPDNTNTPTWDWHDGAAPAPDSVCVPWDLDSDMSEPEPEPEPIPIEPMPPMPTDWSDAERLSLEWYSEGGHALDAIYCNLLTPVGATSLRHADPGGWGNWWFHIVQESWSVQQVVDAIKTSDEYHAAHPEG
jgi:hypothetical protein